MKVKLTMEFDIPESHYKDAEEDKNIKPEDLFKHEFAYVKQSIVSQFINYNRCAHLCDAMDWMVSDSPNKQEHTDSHREWITILDNAEKTMKIEPVFGLSFEEFKRQFDEMMANITDEELVAEFKAMGCDVEIRKDTYGDDIIPEHIKY